MLSWLSAAASGVWAWANVARIKAAKAAGSSWVFMGVKRRESFGLECLRRVEPRGAEGGNEGGGECHRGEKENQGSEHEGIGGCDAVQRPAQQVRDAERPGKPRADADAGQQRRAGEHP